MTVVVGVATYTDAFIVADCQLTFNQQGTLRRRDFCQKLIVTNPWSVVGLAGNLCLTRSLANGVITQLQTTSTEQQDLLRDNEKLGQFIEAGIWVHHARNPDHTACIADYSALLIAWLDYSRLAPSGEWMAGPPCPDPRVTVIQWRDRVLAIRCQRRGPAVIGRAPQFARAVHTDDFDDLMTFFCRTPGDDVHPDIRDAQRALLATTAIRKRLIESGRTSGVGGLYQVMTLSDRGVQTVPYFYLADVEPGFQTYVAMRIDNGEWVQEHRPSGTVMRVKSPWDIDPLRGIRSDARFDPSDRLNRHSPGVFPAQQIETVFSLYNPPHVPDAVRPSWGDEPLAPLTYGPEYPGAGNHPRWPGVD